MSDLHHRPRDPGRQFTKLPARPDHASSAASSPSRQPQSEPIRHPPSGVSDKPLVIDLTGSNSTSQPFPSSRKSNAGTPNLDAAGLQDVPSGIVEAAKVYDGVLCSKAATQNSRSGKRLRFAARTPAASPQFIQPSKVYSNNKHPATPPAIPRGGAGARQKQIQPQPSKVDFTKPNPRRDNKPKPYVLEPSPAAQLYPDSKCSDFFPWKGNHTEDHVTDTQARNGHFDKLFAGKGNNEQASARASLAPIFKQKSGLSTMSSLFLTVLDKRQKYGRITTPSTFKPPPRVTLPDTRREAWLRDLASPLVSLRKLSRTIPHGLKGPILLDQCTAKNIPTARAVWFARCVGANELRGLKRKGVGSFAVGSETKWIKEWTSQVVRFLDKTIVACSSTSSSTSSWKSKMIYAVRLSAHLYAENLLDRTLFLEWYLTFLETSSLDVLPMAYMLSSIYWDDLLRTRRLGRRLAEALLGKAEAILAVEDKEVYVPLMQKLSVMLTDILLSHRESLVISNSWDVYEKVLSCCIDCRSPILLNCFSNVSSRNKNLLAPMDHKHDETTLSTQRRLINILDVITMPYNLDELWLKCYSTATDHSELVQCLCEWGTTSLRVGVHRIYIVAALLRTAQRVGVAVQEQVLVFLDGFGTKVAGSKEGVYLLISELVRSKTFAVAGYMKWLIARGSLYGFDSMHKENPCHVRLLAEVPIYTSPTPHRNLRKILLLNTGFDIEEESRSLETAKEILNSRVSGIFDKESISMHSDESFSSQEMDFFRGLSRTVMSELGIWIRDNVRMHVVKGQPVGRDNWRDLSVEVGITAVTTTQFILLRGLLELFQDMVVLVDVVRMVSSSDSSNTLSEAADTVSYNIEAFSVLGAVNECLRLLHNRYKKLQVRRPLEKFLVVSLADLASFPGANEDIRRQLGDDLVLHDQRFPRAGMANSPVSDTMADIFDGGSADSNEEIDRLLASGATIDNHNLSRLFETIVSKVETTFDDSGVQGQLSSSVSYLTKLRQFDVKMFDELMRGWVTRLLQSSSRPPLLQTMSVLVASSCLELEVVVSATLAVLKPDAKLPNVAAGELAAQTLDLLVSQGSTELRLSPQEMYSLNRKRKIFELKFTEPFVRLVCRSIELCATAQNSDLAGKLRGLVLSRSVLHLLRGLATARPEILISDIVEPLSRKANAGVLQWLRVLIDHLLDDHESGDMADLDPEVQVAQLIQYANDFSIGLCQLKMRIIFDAENKNASSRRGGDATGSAENPLMKPFFQGIASTFKDRVNIWTDLVSVLNQECASQIRMYAEELVLTSSTFPPVRLCLGPLEPPLPEGRESGESLARALLSVIEATAYSIPSQGVASIASMLVDKLNMIVQSLTLVEDDLEKGDHAISEVLWNDSLTESRCWLLLFLRMIVLHRAAFLNSRSGVSDQGKLVVGLCTLLQHEFVQKDEDLFDFVFDITSSFIDDLPEDARLQVRRFVRGKKPTPRMSYLVGGGEIISIGGGGEWLKAFQRGKLIDYPMKPWEKLAEPSPIIGENDTSISLTLFKTRRARCHKADG